MRDRYQISCVANYCGAKWTTMQRASRASLALSMGGRLDVSHHITHHFPRLAGQTYVAGYLRKLELGDKCPTHQIGQSR